MKITTSIDNIKSFGGLNFISAEFDKAVAFGCLPFLLLNNAINTSELTEVHKVLPWVHSAIGNAKKLLGGIHHSNGQDYLQNYLNEYCYKYNRRYFGERIFDRGL